MGRECASESVPITLAEADPDDLRAEEGISGD